MGNNTRRGRRKVTLKGRCRIVTSQGYSKTVSRSAWNRSDTGFQWFSWAGLKVNNGYINIQKRFISLITKCLLN